MGEAQGVRGGMSTLLREIPFSSVRAQMRNGTIIYTFRHISGTEMLQQIGHLYGFFPGNQIKLFFWAFLSYILKIR